MDIQITERVVRTHIISLGGRLDTFNAPELRQHFQRLITVCAYLFLKSLDYDLIFRKLPFIERIVTAISTCSLGIYFVHVMIIELLQSGRLGIHLDATTIHPLIGIPVTTLVAMIASIAVISFLKKLPILRFFVP